jgi:hypothetical protein
MDVSLVREAERTITLSVAIIRIAGHCGSGPLMSTLVHARRRVLIASRNCAENF